MTKFGVETCRHQLSRLRTDAKRLPELHSCKNGQSETSYCHPGPDEVSSAQWLMGHHEHCESKEDADIGPVECFHKSFLKAQPSNLAQVLLPAAKSGALCRKRVAHARPPTGTRKPCKPCHSERSEESRSDLFVLASSRTRARFFASLRMTAHFQSRSKNACATAILHRSESAIPNLLFTVNHS